MATPTFRDRECRELLAFDEVRHRLGLGTRLPGGRREVAVADIIGSVGRVSDFDGCFRPRNRRLRDEIRARAASPAVVDMPLSLLQVDHAFFVEDGHKRLSAAIADGRRYVDAERRPIRDPLPRRTRDDHGIHPGHRQRAQVPERDGARGGCPRTTVPALGSGRLPRAPGVGEGAHPRLLAGRGTARSPGGGRPALVRDRVRADPRADRDRPASASFSNR